MKVYKVTGIDVDSGSFVLADPEVFGGDFSALKGLGYAAVKVPVGTYKCNWKVTNSPERDPTGTGTLRVVSGIVYAFDPLYVSSEYLWDDRYRSPRGVVHVDKTGGDGTFNLEFSLTRKK